MKSARREKPIPHVVISQDFGQDPPSIYCPVCGTLILGNDQENTCEHVLFSYVSEADEFSTMASAYREALEKITARADPSNWVKKALKLFKGKESVFCLTINFGGFACGPIGFAVSVAFDISPKGWKHSHGDDRE
ncbi:MAG: hypothetical protein WHS46_10205 [Desulfosoma sp.]